MISSAYFGGKTTVEAHTQLSANLQYLIILINKKKKKEELEQGFSKLFFC